MKLEILQVPDCPNVELLERRIAEAVASEQIDVTIAHRVLDDQAVAAEAGMKARCWRRRSRRWCRRVSFDPSCLLLSSCRGMGGVK